MASPLTTLKRTNLESDLVFLDNIIKQNNVSVVVIGYPYEMSGNKGKTVLLCEEFAQKLKDFSKVEIVFVDERLSSVEADEILKRTIKDWKKRKELLDQVSASIILQTYLDSK